MMGAFDVKTSSTVSDSSRMRYMRFSFFFSFRKTSIIYSGFLKRGKVVMPLPLGTCALATVVEQATAGELGPSRDTTTEIRSCFMRP